MNKPLLIILLTFLVAGTAVSETGPDILPLNILAFPFGSEDHQQKIISDIKNTKIWSEKRIMAWAQEQGFYITADSPSGGFQYKRGMIIKSPGIDFILSTPVTARAENQVYGWKLVLDAGSLYSPAYEDQLSSNFKNYENILRYDIYIDNIFYRSVESGYGISFPTPITIDIPYIRDVSGKVKISIRLKNHPANFAVIYDAYLTL